MKIPKKMNRAGTCMGPVKTKKVWKNPEKVSTVFFHEKKTTLAPGKYFIRNMNYCLPDGIEVIDLEIKHDGTLRICGQPSKLGSTLVVRPVVSNVVEVLIEPDYPPF